MGGISQTSMNDAEHWFCLPVVMLINFALFQYLLVLYYRRRAEPRIALLLMCAFLGFAVIIPQAHPRDVMVGHLNDISETCSTLTFLVQITTIGRDIERKVRIWSLKILTYVAELLTVIGLLVVVLNVIEVVAPSSDLSAFDGIDNIVEICSLFYVFFFRFFYIAISRGIKWTLANKKLEIFLYFLFVTHELPFMLLEELTGVTWEPVQAIWHRLSLMMCILMTIKEKMSARRTKASKENKTTTGGFTQGPSIPNLQDAEEESDTSSNVGKKRKFNFPSKAKLFGGKVMPSSSNTTRGTSGTSSFLRSGLLSIRGRSQKSARSSRGGHNLSITPGPRNE